MRWFTYILLCGDNSFYVGHTNDLAARLTRHNSGRGAQHLAAHGRAELVFGVARVGQATARRAVLPREAY